MLHERLLLGLGTLTGVALAWATSWAVAAAVLGGTLAYALWIRATTTHPRLRLAAAYAYTLAFYTGVEWIVPALGRSAMDSTLLAADEALFGETPAVTLARVQTVALSEVMSACYLSYHLYLHGALLWALRRPDERLYSWVFTVFALGLAGYLLVPALGPAVAYPALFPGPIEGGRMTTFTAAFIARGESMYDVFPSLHVLITLALLDHDWRWTRRRFWWAVVPAAGLLLSTVYLRYHYAVDLLAGVGVWWGARTIFRFFAQQSRPAVDRQSTGALTPHGPR